MTSRVFPLFLGVWLRCQPFYVIRPALLSIAATASSLSSSVLSFIILGLILSVVFRHYHPSISFPILDSTSSSSPHELFEPIQPHLYYLPSNPDILHPHYVLFSSFGIHGSLFLSLPHTRIYPPPASDLISAIRHLLSLSLPALRSSRAQQREPWIPSSWIMDASTHPLHSPRTFLVIHSSDTPTFRVVLPFDTANR